MLRIWSTYMASHWFKKLISVEEISQDVLITTFRNLNIEMVMVSEFHPPYTTNESLDKKTILRKEEREEQLQSILKRWEILKTSPETYKINCTIKQYIVNHDFTLYVLECSDLVRLIGGKYALISFKHFQ
ncbi:MAG: hypothetical protein NTY80_02000 [candidate division SR1 bacterium]|nr:hypothetical protein [candidate division SR1 bacterium]